MASQITRDEWSDNWHSICGAIREAYGYNDFSESLIEFLYEATDSGYGKMVKAE